MTREEVEELYDRHAPRLYALALRITNDRDASAAVLEEVFVAAATRETRAEADLIRLTRDRAVARQAQTPRSSVESQREATPRLLVEDAFFGGMSVAELAKAYSLTEGAVRTMLRDGMAELRRQFATGGTK